MEERSVEEIRVGGDEVGWRRKRKRGWEWIEFGGFG